MAQLLAAALSVRNESVHLSTYLGLAIAIVAVTALVRGNTYASRMTMESMIAFFAQTAPTVGAAVLTALAVSIIKSIPRLLRGLFVGVTEAPERILLSVLNAIDRRASNKNGELL